MADNVVFTEGATAEVAAPPPATAEVPEKTIYNAEFDINPGFAMGMQCIISSIWWFSNWFVYIKNYSSDDDLRPINGSGTVLPFMWWWERAAQTNGLYVWLAVSLIVSFVLGFFISVLEMVAWGLYMMDDYEFARIWMTTVGYWGSIIFYTAPFFLAMLHIIFNGAQRFGGTWAIYQMVGSAANWILTMLIHIYFIDDFISFLDSRTNEGCVCDAPEILPLADDADLETKLAWQFATEQRERVCAIQCPITVVIQPKCGLQRLSNQSDLEYELACEALERETQSLESVSFQSGDSYDDVLEQEVGAEGW